MSDLLALIWLLGLLPAAVCAIVVWLHEPGDAIGFLIGVLVWPLIVVLLVLMVFAEFGWPCITHWLRRPSKLERVRHKLLTGEDLTW